MTENDDIDLNNAHELALQMLRGDLRPKQLIPTLPDTVQHDLAEQLRTFEALSKDIRRELRIHARRVGKQLWADAQYNYLRLCELLGGQPSSMPVLAISKPAGRDEYLFEVVDGNFDSTTVRISEILRSIENQAEAFEMTFTVSQLNQTVQPHSLKNHYSQGRLGVTQSCVSGSMHVDEEVKQSKVLSEVLHRMIKHGHSFRRLEAHP